MTPATGIEAVATAVRSAGSFAVAGHVGPDGDALGSMLALVRAGRTAGKKAWATFGEPFVTPRQLGFLAGGDDDLLVREPRVPRPLDLLIVVDCGEPDRLGSAATLAEEAATVAVIDHHRSSDGGFGDAVWIEPDAGATAEMVHRMLGHLGWPIDRAIADALYTGIVTDTGRFQYSATSPGTHRIAAELLEAGVRSDEIGQRIFEHAPFPYLGVAAAVLGRATLDEELRLVWSTLLVSDLEKAGIGYEEADGLIDLIRVADGAEAACLLRQLGDHRTKGSLRSRGRVDVGAVAATLGGGGHHNAAGFTVEATVDEAITLVRGALR